MKVLIISTSHGWLGATGIPTGLGLETLAGPYFRFLDAGVEVKLASPKGGRPPIDPVSVDPETATQATKRFEQDVSA